MSGKYAKKTTKRSGGKRKNSRVPLLLTVLAVLLAVFLVMLFLLGRDPSGDTSGQTDMPTQTSGETHGEAAPTAAAPTQETAPVTQSPQETGAQPALQDPFDLGSGVKITRLLPYTGAFMEDRTDEVVTDVLAIQVTNSGEKFIQTMDITLSAGDTRAEFTLTTLFPGETVVVLEKNRMAYSTAPEFDQVQTGSVALFEEHPGLCEDRLEIQCLDGIINITNISDEDITGDILIYYKNYVSGVYYGGITYRIRVEGGLKVGQIHQGTAAHFNPDNSVVVFVSCG